MRSLSEWLMREMQDRLTELRGMTARSYPYSQRPGEPGHAHFQSHYGVSMAPPGTCPRRNSTPMPRRYILIRPFLSRTHSWNTMGSAMVSPSTHVLQRDAIQFQPVRRTSFQCPALHVGALHSARTVTSATAVCPPRANHARIWDTPCPTTTWHVKRE